MTIKSNFDEYIVSASSSLFRVSLFHKRYFIERFEQPCNDLTYICDFGTLGECLVFLLKFEIGNS